ncbi:MULTISPECIES: hypothetical protein [Streptomyces]|uniref:Uncharacterized protein n=1 Tax=Streptomyces lasiicapitis TaxID=1923961 RepID=A0ABQ2M105_9ACTN|nr:MULTISPECIES: hypothetical protein [Streptomyces]QIB48357.1 hypothetical protein G3H79_40040 [Streptomyces aureoverticillatus]GGO45342.1 hypothetical protein GCM10012286_33640 [Streptomyces lasiicapitis]
MTRTIRRTALAFAALALGTFAWSWVNSEPQAGDTTVTAAWMKSGGHHTN